MMTDARLSLMLRAVGELVQVYDSGDPETVIATPRGVFTKTFEQFDSSPEFGTQFEHTVDAAFFVTRTADVGDWKGKMIRLTKGAFQHRAGATEKGIYRVDDIRPDGHGMSALVLHR